MNLINKIILAIMLLYGALLGSEKLAQTGFQFLSISTDARSGGMADAITTYHGGSISLHANPAGLSRQKELFDVDISMNNWIADIKHSSLTMSYRPDNGEHGVFGLSFLNVDYGEIQGTMVWDNEMGYIDTERFDPSAMSLGFGYGRALSENFSVGIQMKRAYQYLGRSVVPISDSTNTLMKNTANALAFDFGTIYITDWHDFTFGMSVRNFSEEVQFAYDGFQLPLTFRIGGSMNLLSAFGISSEIQTLLIAVDALHPRSYPERLNVGLEYSFNKLAHLRIGYLNNYDERNLTYGFGIAMGSLKIDYALTPFGVFDSVNRLSIGISI